MNHSEVSTSSRGFLASSLRNGKKLLNSLETADGSEGSTGSNLKALPKMVDCGRLLITTLKLPVCNAAKLNVS